MHTASGIVAKPAAQPPTSQCRPLQRAQAAGWSDVYHEVLQASTLASARGGCHSAPRLPVPKALQHRVVPGRIRPCAACCLRLLRGALTRRWPGASLLLGVGHVLWPVRGSILAAALRLLVCVRILQLWAARKGCGWWTRERPSLIRWVQALRLSLHARRLNKARWRPGRPLVLGSRLRGVWW